MEKERSRGRVLVVDDDAQIREALTRALVSEGYEVDAAPDGAVATKFINGREYDLVLTDIQLPGVNGMALLRLVRQRDLDLPVILMAGAPSIETATQAVEQGALRYLLKPFDSREVVDAVNQGVALYDLAKVKGQLLEMMDTTQGPADRAGLGVALDRTIDGLWMAYQPIVSWSNRSLFGYEALMRSTESSLPHPGAILEAAERLGRIHELGRSVRRKVAEALDREPEMTCFINLHTFDLMDEELFDRSSPLARHSPRVVFEVTERAALDRVSDVKERTKRLRHQGYRIAVDDLGAGYAGLTSFAHLEPDIVKLDMSLVRDIHLEPTRRALVVGLVGACRNLGVDVVGEGVEAPEERDALATAGVDLLQGYYFGRPQKDLFAPNFGSE